MKTNTQKNNWYDSYNNDFYHYSWKRFIDKETTILGIGGCFNSNFLKFLQLSGINVLPSTWGLHYDPFTILNELYKTFDKNKSSTLYWEYTDKNNNGVLVDSLRHQFLYSSTNEFFKQDELITKQLKDSIINSNTIIISFAISEIWEQKVNNKWIIINRTPPDELLFDNRYVFRHRNLSLLECKNYINKIIKLLNDFNDSLNIILMVIPIPLKTSYRDMHPKISDILTKSRLLVAIDDIFEKNKNNNIVYFPAYEIFQYFNNKKDLFQCDCRHLKASAISYIGKKFIDYFTINKDFIKNVENFTVKQVNI